MERKRLLCIVYEPGNFLVFLEMAKFGHKSNLFDAILWSPYCLPDSVRYQAEALAADTVYVEESTPVGGLADIFTRLSGWLSSKPMRLPLDLQAKISGQKLPPDTGNSTMVAETLVSEMASDVRYATWCQVDHIRRRISFCEDWLVRLGIDAVVLAEDNVERDSYGWIAGAKRRGIRTVVTSYGAISDQEAVNAYRNSSSHAVNATQATLIRRHLPKWLAEGDGFAITRLPFTEAIARELTDTAPFNPWLVNTGDIDAIALESATVERTYLDYGFQASKLKLIGHPMHDLLSGVERERDDRRANIFDKFNFDYERPLAVVCMPPDQLATSPGCYCNYTDIIFAFSQLPKKLAGMNVVVSPHPNISLEGLSLIRAAGVALEEVSASQLIPIADFYIASVSSTIKWALACGIPVINYDCYGYGYPDYQCVPQVIEVSDEGTYRAVLNRLSDTAEQVALKQLAKTNAGHWGVIDGMALSRLVDLCFEE